jgi:hypothetical protein
MGHWLMGYLPQKIHLIHAWSMIIYNHRIGSSPPLSRCRKETQRSPLFLQFHHKDCFSISDVMVRLFLLDS